MTKAFEDLKSPYSMYENLFYAWEHYISLFGLSFNVNNCDEQIWGLDCLYKRSTHRKNCLKKIRLDYQHCNASKSRAQFWIYVGNQKHPKLSYYTSHES